MEFDPSQSAQGNTGELIPAGVLALCTFKAQSINNSKQTGGEYAKGELTIVSGPYARRKIFVNNLMNADDKRNSDKAREMAIPQFCRIFECVGVFIPGDVASYKSINDFRQAVEALETLTTQNGRYMAIKIGIEKGKDGYEDKNSVANYLSPNPASAGHKDYVRLQTQLTQERAGGVAPATNVGYVAPNTGAVAAQPWQTPGARAPLAAPSWAGPAAAPPAGPVNADEIPF